MSKIHNWGDAPNPGSDEALDKDCTCPVLDNHHGMGVGGAYWITSGCILHDPKPYHPKDNNPKTTGGEADE